MHAIDLIQSIKRLITCAHPPDVCVGVILEGHHCVQCAACGAWSEVAGPGAEHWNRPAFVLALDTAAQDFADHALSAMPDERPELLRHRAGLPVGVPPPPASETRMAAAEAGRAAERVMQMLFATSFDARLGARRHEASCAHGDCWCRLGSDGVGGGPSEGGGGGSSGEEAPSMAEVVRCLALCVEQLAAYQNAHWGRNVPAGYHVARLDQAAGELRVFLRVLELHEDRVQAARAAGSGALG